MHINAIFVPLVMSCDLCIMNIIDNYLMQQIGGASSNVNLLSTLFDVCLKFLEKCLMM